MCSSDLGHSTKCVHHTTPHHITPHHTTPHHTTPHHPSSPQAKQRKPYHTARHRWRVRLICTTIMKSSWAKAPSDIGRSLKEDSDSARKWLRETQPRLSLGVFLNSKQITTSACCTSFLAESESCFKAGFWLSESICFGESCQTESGRFP